MNYGEEELGVCKLFVEWNHVAVIAYRTTEQLCVMTGVMYGDIQGVQCWEC